MIIVLQKIHLSNHHLVHLKLRRYVNISIRSQSWKIKTNYKTCPSRDTAPSRQPSGTGQPQSQWQRTQAVRPKPNSEQHPPHTHSPLTPEPFRRITCSAPHLDPVWWAAPAGYQGPDNPGLPLSLSLTRVPLEGFLLFSEPLFSHP